MKFLMTALLISSCLAHAQDLEISSEDCNSPTTRAEKAICLLPEVSDADAVLNRTYHDVIHEIDTKCRVQDGTCQKLKAQLKNAEIHWILYRDSFCELEVMPLKDSDEADLTFATCLVSQIHQKTEDLRIEQLNFRTLYHAK